MDKYTSLEAMTAVLTPETIQASDFAPRPTVVRAIEVCPPGSGPQRLPGSRADGVWARVLISRAPMEGPTREYQGSACRRLIGSILGSAPFKSTAHRADCSWTLEKLPSGAPVLNCALAESAHSVSISHSGRWLAVAVAQNAGVGLDIECGRPGMRTAEMAAFMGWDEVAAGRDGFLARWTLWEACVKQLGSGVFSRPGQAFEALAPCASETALTAVGKWAAVRGRVPAGPYFALVLELDTRQPLQARDVTESHTCPAGGCPDAE